MRISKINRLPAKNISRYFNNNTMKNNKKKQRTRKPRPLPTPPKPPVKTTLAVYGNGIHERTLARQLNGGTFDFSTYRRYNTLVFLYPCMTKKLKRIAGIKKRNPGTRIVLWWIGSDVLYLKENPTFRIRFRRYNRWYKFKNYCVSEQLRRELKSCGINASVITLTPGNVSTMKTLPLPKKYTVAVYIPSNRPEFFKWSDIKRIAQLTPDINYIVYGNQTVFDRSWSPNNIRFVGWVDDTVEIFKQCNCLLRLTKHDGFPKGIIEAVCYGRFVITNHAYPELRKYDNVAKIVRVLKTKPKIPNRVCQYYRKVYNGNDINKRFSIE